MTEYITNYTQQKYDKSKSTFNQFPATRNIQKNLRLISDLKNKENTPTKNTSDKVAMSSIAGGLLLLFFSLGGHKNAKNGLEKLKGVFEKKLDKDILSEQNKKLPFYEYAVRKINSFIQKTESVNNVTSLKDILFMKLMYKSTPTKKIHSGISNIFEKLSINTVKKSYKKTQKRFNDMYENFDKLDNYILKNNPSETVEFKGKQLTKAELVKKAKSYRESVKLVVDAFMDEHTQKQRYKYIKNATSKLYSNFWNESFKDFWSKDNKFKRKQMWQTFIASEQVKGNKTDLAENVAFARNMLSYTDKERMNFISGYVKNLSSIIMPDDKKGVEIMKRIEWFANDPSALDKSKEAFFKEIDKLEQHTIKTSTNENIARTQVNDKNVNIRLLRNILKEDGTGELQDMLDIYHTISPFELAKSGALKSAQNAVSSFDNSVNLEIGEFFDKARDLELGCAPTDILTILMSCGMITYGLNKAKEKNERTSVLLKSGIPIIGAMATSLISATKLVSGGKSLALGFVSGIVLNQLGQITDNYRKAHLTKKK